MTYRIPLRVAHVVPDGEPDPPESVFVMDLPDGVPIALHGSAACIWLLAAEGQEDVAGAIADLAGMARADVVINVERFLAELVRRGLLAVGPPPT
jgi:hypothetical protein